jgi:hypothetical protein
MKLVYYLPDRNGKNDETLITELNSHQVPVEGVFDHISGFERKLEEIIKDKESSEEVIVVLSGHGRSDDGAIMMYNPPEVPLTPGLFFNGKKPEELVKILEKTERDAWVGSDPASFPWPGICALLKGCNRRVYILAAQCYGLKFTSKEEFQVPDNVFVLGLSWGKTHVETQDDMHAEHKEVWAHVAFIQQIERAFRAELMVKGRELAQYPVATHEVLRVIGVECQDPLPDLKA